MIITTPDGKTLHYPFTSNGCTGYRASKIEMEPDDFRRMLSMLKVNPGNFRACLAQLAGRFPPAAQPQKGIKL